MKHQFTITLGIACLLAVFAVTAQAMMLAPDADTTLSNDSNRGPTINHGSASQLQIRDLALTRVRITYVRYDITGIDSGLFNTATLSGTFKDSGKNGSSDGSQLLVYGLDDDPLNGLGNAWGESEVNYSNASGVDNTSLLGEYSFQEASYLGVINYDGADVQPLAFASNTTDLDLTAFLNADSDGLVTILMMDANATGAEYYIDSKEGNTSDGHGPMYLNFVPEPSVTMLLLGGFGMLSLLRRKK